ncbi:MAG: hypothetical protein HY873_07070 [Chloroflexi bacterium]|nr:hypothetical protein [Chloroflexota bacterium]
MRILALALLVALLLDAIPLTVHRAAIRSVSACQYGPERIDDYFRDADLIALVDVVAAGDGANRAPMLTPTAALTPVSTQTPQWTPTPSGGLRIRLTPLATNTPQPPSGPARIITEDLSGIGAELSLVEAYVGGAPSRFAADASVRSSIERRIRELEAGYGYVTSCSVAGLTPRYQQAARYLGVFTAGPSGEFATTRLFVVEGNEIANANAVGMSYGLYREYFADMKAADITLPTEETPGGYVYVTEARFALARLLQAMRAARTTDYRIYPPDTGSGGLLPGN